MSLSNLCYVGHTVVKLVGKEVLLKEREEERKVFLIVLGVLIKILPVARRESKTQRRAEKKNGRITS